MLVMPLELNDGAVTSAGDLQLDLETMLSYYFWMSLVVDITMTEQPR